MYTVQIQRTSALWSSYDDKNSITIMQNPVKINQFLIHDLIVSINLKTHDRQRIHMLLELGFIYLRRKFGFIKRVDKGRITTVKDLESWRFERPERIASAY